MKKIFTLLLVMTASSVAWTQQLNLTQFATLNHNDTITAYYGVDALVSALSSAEHGDIITLSPGSFNAPYDISKAVTIRGAGMMIDTISNTEPTRINKSFYLSVPNVSNLHLTMEGVYITGNIVYISAYSPRFNKCRINTIRKSASGEKTMSLPVFTNCLISAWDGSSSISNAMFINSIILNSWQGEGHGVSINSDGGISEYYYWGYDLYTCGQSSDVYYNCIINIPPSIIHNKRNIINCITFGSDSVSVSDINVFNSVGIFDSTSIYNLTPDHNNTNINSFENIFKTFRGTYTEGEMFELTNNAASNYLGSDNTQVGIYGGSAVFNPKATDMRIKKYSVGFYSDENGHLKITTELENE